MDSSVLVAIITAAVAVALKIWSDYNTKKQEREVARANEKLNHYKVLLSSLSDMSSDKQNKDFVGKFALATNTIALVAPHEVINELMNYIDWIIGKKEGSGESLLEKLILAIRKDIGIRDDNEQTFRYKLVQYSPKNGLLK